MILTEIIDMLIEINHKYKNKTRKGKIFKIL